MSKQHFKMASSFPSFSTSGTGNTLLLVLVLACSTYIDFLDACSCGTPEHYQNTFCKAAFAMKTTVRSTATPVTQRSDLLEFTVEILEDFLGTDLPELKEGERLHTRIITAKDPELCGGVELKQEVDYLITGNNDNDGVPRLSLCDWFDEWEQLQNETTAGLRGGFDCSCAVIRCTDAECGGNSGDGYCKVYGGSNDYKPGCLCSRISVNDGCQWNHPKCGGSLSSLPSISGTASTTTASWATAVPSIKPEASAPPKSKRKRAGRTKPGLEAEDLSSVTIDPQARTTEPPVFTTDNPLTTTDRPIEASTEQDRTLDNSTLSTMP